MKNIGIQSDKSKDFLNEDVKTVIYLSFDVDTGSRILKSCTRTQYNIDGQTIRGEDFELDGTGLFNSYGVSRFDAYGRKIGVDTYIRDEFYSSQKFLLDSKGRITSIYNNDNTEPSSIYIYDDISNTRESIYFDTHTHTLYEFDPKGLAVRLIYIIGLTPLSDYIGPIRQSEIVTIVNDSKGNEIEWKSIDAVTNEIKKMQKNTLNEMGDEIETVNYNGDSSVYSVIQHEYIYDHKNNWVFRRTFFNSVKPFREHKRIITYHSDSF
jgi:hypothetical protein